MEKFRTVTYEIHNPKIKKGSTVRFALLADVHGSVFGEKNRILVERIEKWNPDAILVAGDMVVRREPATIKSAQCFLEQISRKYPVFYAPGNHESKMRDAGYEYHREYQEYEDSLKQAGICMLYNERAEFEAKRNHFVITGLELPLEYYKKPFSPGLTREKIKELAGGPAPERINILLAHNPKYGDCYFRWGADLILSGHYHGGIFRFSRHIGAISSCFIPFPRYCCGDFYRGSQCMLVSAGLGEHTVPLRIHNPRELILIEMKA